MMKTQKNWRRSVLLSFALTSLYGLSAGIYAQSLVDRMAQIDLQTQIDVGVSSMHADEVFMFDDEHKVSELLWHVSGLPTLGMHSVAQLNNHWHIDFDARYAQGGRNGTMDDYDWLYEDVSSVGFDDWSHHSTHNTDGQYVMLHLNTAYDYMINAKTTLVSTVGLGFSDLNWHSYGGQLNYSSEPDDPETGNPKVHPGADGSTFRDQSFSAPSESAAINFEVKEQALELSERLIYQPNEQSHLFVSLGYGLDNHFSDQDVHVQRSLTFVDDLSPEVSQGEAPHKIMLSIGGDYELDNGISLYGQCQRVKHSVNFYGDDKACKRGECDYYTNAMGVGYKVDGCSLGIATHSVH